MAKQIEPKGSAARDGKFSFDWNLMQTFLTVIDEGSLQGAARALGQSQPTMGRHIELLEHQLNAVLFERTGRALVATDVGRHLAEVARSMQQGADSISRSISNIDDTFTGTVRVSASCMVATYILPEIVHQIHRAAPCLNLAIVSTDSVSNLLRRDADIAVRMTKPIQSDIVAKRLGHVALLPCASRSYIDRWGMPSNLKDLFSHRLVGPDQDTQILKGAAKLLESVGKDPSTVQLVFRSDDFVVQAEAIKAGLGVGFVAEYMFANSPDLVTLPFASPFPPLPIWLAVHREIHTTPRIRLVYDQLSTHLKASLSA